MKRHIASVAAAAMTVTMPLSIAMTSVPSAAAAPAQTGALDASTSKIVDLPAAAHDAGTPQNSKIHATNTAGMHDTQNVHWDQATQDLIEKNKAGGHWTNYIIDKQKNGANVRLGITGSDAMNKASEGGAPAIPFVVIRPKGVSDDVELPTLYLLNGADGGEGNANWIAQSDIVEYYGGDKSQDGKLQANVVIPMSGAFSYYTDWQNPYSAAKYHPKWETYLTQELPNYLKEAGLGMSDKKAIAGMSMSATSSLAIAGHQAAEGNPYNAVGSFSGCASTTQGLAPAFVTVTLNRGETSMAEMWGATNSEAARANDMVVNAKQLKNQPNLYVSNGSGLIGRHDVLSSKRVNGNIVAATQVAVEGGVIEAATNGCTHDLQAKLNSLGKKDATFKFRNQGTHQWGYWQDELRDFLPVVKKGFGLN